MAARHTTFSILDAEICLEAVLYSRASGRTDYNIIEPRPASLGWKALSRTGLDYVQKARALQENEVCKIKTQHII